MSLIDAKYREAANVLASADDEVLETAGMVALMRLGTLNRRMKGFATEKALTPPHISVCFPMERPPPMPKTPTTVVPTWQAPSLPKSTSNQTSGDFKFAGPQDYLTKPQSLFTAPSTGFGHPSKSNRGGTGFLFGSPPIMSAKTTVPFSNSEVSGSQSLPATSATGNPGDSAAETRVFGNVQSGVAFDQSETNSLVAKPEEKRTIQTKQVPEVSEWTKLTQKNEENSKVTQSIQNSKLTSLKQLKKKDTYSFSGLKKEIASIEFTDDRKFDDEKNIKALALSENRKREDPGIKTGPNKDIKNVDFLQLGNAHHDRSDEKSVGRIVDQEEKREFLPERIKVFPKFEQTHNFKSFGSQFWFYKESREYKPELHVNNYTLNFSPVYNYLENPRALGPRRSSANFGGCGCRQIQCADRRCGCKKSGTPCHGGCLCSSRGGWCLNR